MAERHQISSTLLGSPLRKLTNPLHYLYFGSLLLKIVKASDKIEACRLRFQQPQGTIAGWSFLFFPTERL